MATNNSIGYEVLDEDTMSSDSNTAIATQQSIKAYVDAQVSTGNYIHIDTQTASSVASIDFEGLDSTYSEYLFHFYGLLPATDGATLYARYGTGGTPTYQTSSYKYAIFTNDYNAASGATGSTSAAQIQLVFSAQGNASSEHVSGTACLYNPSGTTFQKDLIFRGTRVTTTNAYGNESSAARWASNTAVTALQFYYSSGNISVGTFKLYGLTGS